MIHQLLRLRDVHPNLRILCHFTYSATRHVYECSYSFIFILVRVCVLNAKVWAKFDFLFWGKSPTKPLFTLHLADMESHLQEDFQSDIDATLHASSSDEQVFMASATCTWSMGAESRWNILLLHRASTKINYWTGSSLIFQTIPNDRISNTSSWNIRQMGISRRPFCQHKWVSILSKLTLQAKFHGNSTTKLNKLGGFRLVSDVKETAKKIASTLRWKNLHLGIASFAENIFQRMRKTLHHGLAWWKNHLNVWSIGQWGICHSISYIIYI